MTVATATPETVTFYTQTQSSYTHACDISDYVSAPTLTNFSLAEDDSINSDTRNCDTLHANTDQLYACY